MHKVRSTYSIWVEKLEHISDCQGFIEHLVKLYFIQSTSTLNRFYFCTVTNKMSSALATETLFYGLQATACTDNNVHLPRVSPLSSKVAGGLPIQVLRHSLSLNLVLELTFVLLPQGPGWFAGCCLPLQIELSCFPRHHPEMTKMCVQAPKYQTHFMPIDMPCAIWSTSEDKIPIPKLHTGLYSQQTDHAPSSTYRIMYFELPGVFMIFNHFLLLSPTSPHLSYTGHIFCTFLHR